jgi:large subunit ribosomal protein L23
MELYKVLERPLITEKTTALAQKGKFTFQVARDANKALIKQAVQERFKGVNVVSVNVITVQAKEKGAGRRRGHAPAWKKAIVTLKEGQTIPEFSGNL